MTINGIRNFAALVCYFIVSALHHGFMLTTAVLHAASNIVALVIATICTPLDWLAFSLGNQLSKHEQ